MIKTTLTGAAIAAATIACVPQAHADVYGYQDSRYIACLSRYAPGVYDASGPAALAMHGREWAQDIGLGIRTIAEEEAWVYVNTPSSITRGDSVALVTCAVRVFI